MAPQPLPRDPGRVEGPRLCGRVFGEFMVEGRRIRIRGLCPDDRDRLLRFYERLSAETIYTRFFSIMRYFDPYVDKLISDSKALAIVAEDTSTGEIVGIAEVLLEDGGRAEGGIVVLEELQGRGIGRRLAEAFRSVAVENGVRLVYGYIMPDNIRALRLVRRLGGRILREYPSLYYVEIPVEA